MDGYLKAYFYVEKALEVTESFEYYSMADFKIETVEKRLNRHDSSRQKRQSKMQNGVLRPKLIKSELGEERSIKLHYVIHPRYWHSLYPP